MPDFFIVGQAKSGTTALYEMLRRHPAIFMPDLKEPQYLASDMPLRPRGRMWFRMPSTLDEYLSLFADAPAGMCLGEASTLYLSSTGAASSIHALNPAARIIAIFREPAAFLHSFHLQLRQSHEENARTLSRALALEPDRRRGRSVPRHSHRPRILLYSDHVRYTDQLVRYRAVFPAEQVLVLVYEDFQKDNAGTIRTILRFLDLDDRVPIAEVRANPTVGVRSQIMSDLVRRYSEGYGPFSRAVKVVTKAITPTSARRRFLGAVDAHVVHESVSPPDEALMTDLRRQLKPEVERFSAYLGRDLVTLWGYDRV